MLVDLLSSLFLPLAPRNAAGERTWVEKNAEICRLAAEEAQEREGQTLGFRRSCWLCESLIKTGKSLEFPGTQGSTVWGGIQPHLEGVQSWLGKQPAIMWKDICTSLSPLKTQSLLGRHFFWFSQATEKLMTHNTQPSNSCWWIKVSVKVGRVSKRIYPL